MSTVAEVCAALGLLAVIVWWFNSETKKSKFYKTIPSAPGLPLLGNALDLISTTKVLPALQRYFSKCGKIVKVNIGPIRTVIFITDYKFLEFILSSTTLINKSVEYRYMRNWLGDGLLTNGSSKWKKHRKIITPAFHFKILEQFVEVFESSGDTLVTKLKEHAGTSVDIYPLVTLCALDIICETAMGTTVNAQENEESDYVQSVKEMGRIIIERITSPLQMYDPLYMLTKNYFSEKAALKVLHNYTNKVIDKRRQEKLKTTIVENQESDFEIKKKHAFLDLLLEATVNGEPLSQQEIREEVDTFMFEGHDTTSSGISFTLFCLANHPEVQQRAFEEQQQIFGDTTDCNVAYSDLQKMKYLEQVIKETLRLYPSAPFHARVTDRDMEFDGKIIPEGVTLAIYNYGIHRDPDYFPNPEEFIPSRFDEIDGTSPYSYIPFSAGPRNCIGQKYAMLELKSLVSKVLRNFELTPAVPQHTLQLASEIILKSITGIKIGLKARSTME